MQFFYQPSTRALFIDELGDVPSETYQISKEDYLKIIGAAISISGDGVPGWIIPTPLKMPDQHFSHTIDRSLP